MFDNPGNVQTFLIVFPAHGTSSICRYEERKAKKQDTAENELQIESLCLTNGGNHCFNKVRQLVFLVYYLISMENRSERKEFINTRLLLQKAFTAVK